MVLIIAKNEIKHTRYSNLVETTKLFVFFFCFLYKLLQKTRLFFDESAQRFSVALLFLFHLKKNDERTANLIPILSITTLKVYFIFYFSTICVSKYFILNLFAARVFKNNFLNLAQRIYYQTKTFS